jgi:hypothetical protein
LTQPKKIWTIDQRADGCGKNKRLKGLNAKKGPRRKGIHQWEDMVVILKWAGLFLQNSHGRLG